MDVGDVRGGGGQLHRWSRLFRVLLMQVLCWCRVGAVLVLGVCGFVFVVCGSARRKSDEMILCGSTDSVSDRCQCNSFHIL